ncbi:MAG TPA: type I-U CRISPR-associated protein Cas5/Cas6 [Solibacterales bacterium]|nr:type I-U CRISPR-associated protein Cas5/Cas6 [Bryobacterales bacterium]
MALGICISATFLSGRYHGEEWPPSPVRLFRALVAGAKNGGYREHWGEVANALEWLERLDAPLILAKRPLAARPKYMLAVPNNDMDSVARDWSAGRDADPAKLRTMKLVHPRLLEGDGPHVKYFWTLNGLGLPEKEIGGLRRAAHCVHALGWGVDMAFANLDLPEEWDKGGYEEWRPAGERKGMRLEIPASGSLQDLESTYERYLRRASGVGVDTDTRPSVYRYSSYVRPMGDERPLLTLALRSVDGELPLSRGWHAAMEVAAWLRHACGEVLKGERRFRDDVDSFVLGHGEGMDEANYRLSFVPLPSIGHAHADGRIRRVLIVEPMQSSGEAVEVLGLKLAGRLLTRDGDRAEVASLDILTDRKVLGFYLRDNNPARTWRSVTPVVLHGYNAIRGQISLLKTEKLLLRAFEMAGYDKSLIAGLAFQPAPLWAGTGAARAVRVPKHLDGYPRYHVEVTFKEPVQGPVMAGLGRHCGVGVFAAGGE